MSTVVAAIDNSAAADPVLRTALAVALLTGAEVVSPMSSRPTPATPAPRLPSVAYRCMS